MSESYESDAVVWPTNGVQKLHVMLLSEGFLSSNQSFASSLAWNFHKLFSRSAERSEKLIKNVGFHEKSLLQPSIWHKSLITTYR